MSGDSSGTTTGGEDELPSARIVSVPDFINMDMQYRDPRLFDLTSEEQAMLVEDIEAGGPQAFVNPNVGNYVGTVDNGYRGASQVLLEALGAEQADCFVVSGDLLYTRWPKRSQLGQASDVEIVLEQADIYYDGWIDNVREFSGYDIDERQVFTAVGDHEVGDNNWPEALQALLPVYREVYTTKVGGPATLEAGGYVSSPKGYEGRVYAVLQGNLLIVALDQFAEISSTTGPLDVVGAQLAWLGQTLEQAGDDPRIDHVIVLGHLPVALRRHVEVGVSSGLFNHSDEQGALWQLLVEHGVDLYLPGEVHAISMQVSEGVLQVVTGTNIFQPTVGGPVGSIPFEVGGGVDSEQNYLVIDSYDERLELRIEQIETKLFGSRGAINDPVNDEPYLNREARVTASVASEGFQTVGELVIDTSGEVPVYTHRTGLFDTRWTESLVGPLSQTWNGSIDVDAGTGAGPTAPEFAEISSGGSTTGIVQVRFETDVDSALASRDRGALSARQPDSELARDFVFAVRGSGASYLDVRIGGLWPGHYLFEGLFHDASSSAEDDPLDVRVDVGDGAGFSEAALLNMSHGDDPAAVATAQFEFDSTWGQDVVVRIENLDEDGPHLINGFRLAFLP